MKIFPQIPVILGILIAILSAVEIKPQIPLILFTDIHHHTYTPEPYSLEWLYQVARNNNFTQINAVNDNLDYFINLVEKKLNALEYESKHRNQTFKREAGKSLGFIGSSAIPWAILVSILAKTYDHYGKLDDEAILIGFGVTFMPSFLLWLHGTISLKDAYNQYKNLPNRVEYHQWLLSVLKNKKAESLKTSTLPQGIS